MKPISCRYCNAPYIDFQSNCDQCGASLPIPDETEGKSKLRVWLESLSHRGFIAIGLFSALAIILAYFFITPNLQAKVGKTPNFNNYKIRANLANVLASTGAYRVMLTEYYMANGKFPDSSEAFVNEFGKGALDMDDLIKSMTIVEKGALKMELGKPFKNGVYVRLIPVLSKHETRISWDCETNLLQLEIGMKSLSICRSVN